MTGIQMRWDSLLIEAVEAEVGKVIEQLVLEQPQVGIRYFSLIVVSQKGLLGIISFPIKICSTHTNWARKILEYLKALVTAAHVLHRI